MKEEQNQEPHAGSAKRGDAFWDEMYSQDAYLYGREPNEFFREHLSQLQPGRIVLAAEGEGRNAVYAAGCGWQVDAFDFSAAAKAKAERLARQVGVDIYYRIADFAEPDLVPGSYDVAALIYAHAPTSMRVKGLRAIRESVKPGGAVIVEAFSPEHLSLDSAFGPKSEDLLYTAEELTDAFVGFNIGRLGVERIQLQEGRHSGEGAVVRFVATRQENR